MLYLLKLKDKAGKTQFCMRDPPGNCSSELQKETRISVTIVLRLVAPAWDLPALLPLYSSQKLRKDWNPSAQAPRLPALLDWMKADPQVCCRSRWEGLLPVKWELPQLSYTVHVHPQLELILRMMRYKLKLFGNKPSVWVKAENLLAASGQLLRSNSMPVCHVALHFLKDPTGLHSWERIVKTISITARPM